MPVSGPPGSVQVWSAPTLSVALFYLPHRIWPQSVLNSPDGDGVRVRLPCCNYNSVSRPALPSVSAGYLRLNGPLDTNLMIDLTPTSPLLPDVGHLLLGILLIILLKAAQLFKGDQ